MMSNLFQKILFDLLKSFLMLILLCTAVISSPTLNAETQSSFPSDIKWQKRLDHAQPQVLMVIPWQEKTPDEMAIQTTNINKSQQSDVRSITQTYIIKQWQQTLTP